MVILSLKRGKSYPPKLSGLFTDHGKNMTREEYSTSRSVIKAVSKQLRVEVYLQHGFVNGGYVRTAKMIMGTEHIKGDHQQRNL